MQYRQFPKNDARTYLTVLNRAEIEHFGIMNIYSQSSNEKLKAYPAADVIVNIKHSNSTYSPMVLKVKGLTIEKTGILSEGIIENVDLYVQDIDMFKDMLVENPDRELSVLLIKL